MRRAFGFVRDDVLKSTGNKQEPFVYGSLGGEDVPLVPVKAVPVTAAVPAPAANPPADMRRDYELALQVGNKPAWEAFLAQHPDGFHANLAKLQLDKIQAEQVHAAAIDKAKQAEAERDRLARAWCAEGCAGQGCRIQSSRGSARWSAITASRPTATSAPGSSAATVMC